MTDRAADTRWLRRAIELATQSVAAAGGPFGAVIVREGSLVAVGQNSVTRDLDPSAHAEVVAIRTACRTLDDFALEGCTLYSSCEPCPMCLAASLWARLDRVVYAADRNDAARGGFDDLAFYELFGGGRAADHDDWPTTVEELPIEGRSAPFEAWAAKSDRTGY